MHTRVLVKQPVMRVRPGYHFTTHLETLRRWRAIGHARYIGATVSRCIACCPRRAIRDIWPTTSARASGRDRDLPAEGREAALRPGAPFSRVPATRRRTWRTRTHPERAHA